MSLGSDVDNSETPRLTDDWIASVFAPTFTFDDLAKEAPKKKDDIYVKIYEKVLINEAKEYKEKNNFYDEVKSTDRTQVSKDFNGTKGDEWTSSSQAYDRAIKIERSNILSKKKIIWDESDIRTFRKKYDQLHQRTLKLLCMLESKSVQVEKNKLLCKEARKESKRSHAEVLMLRKEKAELCSTITALEAAIGSQDTRLDFAETQLADLKMKMYERNKDISSERQTNLNSLDTLVSLRTRITEMERQQKIDTEELTRRLKCEYQDNIKRLERELRNTTHELADKREECVAYAKSLTTLTSHFQNQEALIAQEVLNNVPIQSDFLDVVDFTA